MDRDGKMIFYPSVLAKCESLSEYNQKLAMKPSREQADRGNELHLIALDEVMKRGYEVEAEVPISLKVSEWAELRGRIDLVSPWAYYEVKSYREGTWTYQFKVARRQLSLYWKMRPINNIFIVMISADRKVDIVRASIDEEWLLNIWNQLLRYREWF